LIDGADLVLLDTSVVIHLARGRELGRKIEARARLRDRRYVPLVSIVSVAEARVLARRNDWGPKREEQLVALFHQLTTVDIAGSAVVDAWVELRQHCDTARPALAIADNDIWIAATAVAADAVLITTDKDFAALAPDRPRRMIMPAKARDWPSDPK
jgi:predicted nucleic acid-binding protein